MSSLLFYKDKVKKRITFGFMRKENLLNLLTAEFTFKNLLRSA